MSLSMLRSKIQQENPRNLKKFFTFILPRTIHNEQLTTDIFHPSSRFNIALTNFGLALPFVACMTRPTKNPNNLVLPLL